MKPFPFTKTEWATLSESALHVVNASLSEDAVLRESHLVGLLDVLAELRERHGDHPILLETQADFVEEEGERVALYQQAVHLAMLHGLPTLSIRLSLSQVLLDLRQRTAARDELLACEREMLTSDDSDRTTWASLLVESSRG